MQTFVKSINLIRSQTMFTKHPLRDFMLFLVLGVTITFAFNIQAGGAGVDRNHARVMLR